MSPGLDFETRLIAKPNAAARLREELDRPGYRVSPIALGVNTDAYQPLERDQRITRQVLEVLAEYRHPVSIITKGALILRDLDLLREMASDGLCSVRISLTSLSNDLKRRMEPRTAAPGRGRIWEGSRWRWPPPSRSNSRGARSRSSRPPTT